MALLTSIIQNHLEEKHRDEDQRKANLRSMYGKIAFDPDPTISDEHREEARQNLSKLLNPEAKKSLLQKAIPLFDHLHGVAKGLPTPDQAQPGQDSVTLAAPSGGGSMTVQSKLPTPGPVQFPVPSIGTNAERVTASRGVQDAEYNSWLARGKQVLGEKADPRDLAEYAGSKGQRLPAKQQAGTRRAEQWKLGDGTAVDIDFDPKTGVRYDAKGEIWDSPEGATRVGKQANLQLAWFKYPDDKEGDAPHAVRVDPRDPSKQLDASTNQPVPKGANQVDPALIAAKVRQNSYGQYGNLYRAALGQGYSDQEAEKIAGDRVEQEYNKRISMLGAGSIHEAMGEDASGNPVAIQLHTTRVPNAVAPVAPPAAQATAPAAAPGAAAVPATAAPQAPTVIPPVGPAKPVVPPVASGGGIRPIEAFSPAQGRAFREKLIPIRAGATQIFGDPTQPDIKGIVKYIDLADNPQSRERLGKALRLTFDGLADATGHANVSVGAGPVSISAGGIGKMLENAFGVPATVASQQAKMMQDAIKSLTPQEQEYYNAVMTAFGTMVGLRSMTKASAAQGSVAAIERELPVIGINATSRRGFADQAQRLAEEVYNGLQGLSPKALEGAAPGLMEHMKSIPSQMQAIKDQIDRKLPTLGQLPKPPKFGAKLSDDDAMKYMQAAKGDRKKAEEMAKKDGWTF